jgi:hypothetical protein
MIDKIRNGETSGVQRARARNFDLDLDPRITIPARGMSRPHPRGLKHNRTRSHAQKVRKSLHRRGHPNIEADMGSRFNAD